MKLLIFIFLLASYTSLAQYPELLLVRSLVVSGSNSNNQVANAIDLDTLDNVYVIANGASIFNLGLNTESETISSISDQTAIYVRFNDDQFDLGGYGFIGIDFMRVDSSGVILGGLADSSSIFNFSNTPFLGVEGLVNVPRFFFTRYDFEGFPLWTSIASSAIIDATASSDQAFACFQGCTNCGFTDGLGDQYQFTGTAQDGVLLVLDKNTGSLINSKPLLSNGLAVTESVDYSLALQETSYSLFFSGDLDFQWQGASPNIAQAERKLNIGQELLSVMMMTWNLFH